MLWDKYEFIELIGSAKDHALKTIADRAKNTKLAEQKVSKLLGIPVLLGWTPTLTPGGYHADSIWVAKSTPKDIIPKCLRLNKHAKNDVHDNYVPNIARTDGREFAKEFKNFAVKAPLLAFSSKLRGLEDDVIANNGQGQSIMLTQALFKFGTKMAIRIPYHEKNKKRKLPKGLRWVPNSTVMRWVEILHSKNQEPTV